DGRVTGAVAGLVVGPVIGPVVGLCCCRGVGGGAAGLRFRRGVGGGGRGGGGRGGARWVCLRGRRDGIGAVHGVVLPSGVAEGSPCEGTGSEEEVVAVRVGPTGDGAAARRNGREWAAKWGPAWEWRGSSTTVRPREAGAAGGARTGGEVVPPRR